jgi:polyhydroxyalkanoate synthesis regulator phasin
MDTNPALLALRNISPDTTLEEKVERLIDALIAHDDDGDIHDEGNDYETRIAEIESKLADVESELGALQVDHTELEGRVDALPDTD